MINSFPSIPILGIRNIIILIQFQLEFKLYSF